MKKQLENKLMILGIPLSASLLRTGLLILATFSLAACSGSGSGVNEGEVQDTSTSGILDDTQLTEPPITGAPILESPTANFIVGQEATQITGTAPFAVTFADRSVDGSEDITNWFWQFGDGESSNERNPTHTYNNAGTYAVSLTVTNSVDSNEIFKPDTVIVAEPQKLVIIENQDNNTLPSPDPITRQLPSYGPELLVGSVYLDQFNPIVESLKMTSWTEVSAKNNCIRGRGIKLWPKDRARKPKTEWTDSIPKGANNHNFDHHYGPVGGVGKGFPKLPGSIVLQGMYEGRYLVDMTGPINVEDRDGLSKQGARWESCFKDTTNLNTKYTLSHSEKILERPVMRHYKVWKLIGSETLTAGLGIDYTTEEVSALEKTTTDSFEAALSVSIEGGFGPINASVTGSVATAYEESVSKSSQDLKSISYRLETNIKPGYSLLHSTWVLMDRFRIEGNTVGELWKDDNYILAPNQMFLESGPKNQIARQNVWYLVGQ